MTSSDAAERVDLRNLPPVPEEDRPEVAETWNPSQTFLRHHDRCDRAAMLYLVHRAGAGAAQLNRGTIFHIVVERLARWIVEHGEPQATPEQGREFLGEVLDAFPDLQVPAEERDALRYMVDHWCRGTYFPETIIGVETTFSLEVGGFTVQARADLVEDLGGGICQITDYKTAYPPDSDEFRRQAFDREGRPRWAGNYQLNVLAVLGHYGLADDGFPLGDFDRYRLVLAFPRELRPDGIVRRQIEVDKLQLANYLEDLERQLRRLAGTNLAEGRWQPTPGDHCRECPAEYFCPLPRLHRPESQHAELQTIEQLEQAAEAAIFMADRAENLKRRVKKAALRLEEEDPTALLLPGGDRGVRAGKDRAFMFVPSERTKIVDKEAFRLAVDDAAEGGPKPDWEKLERVEESTNFVKRKLAP